MKKTICLFIVLLTIISTLLTSCVIINPSNDTNDSGEKDNNNNSGGSNNNDNSNDEDKENEKEPGKEEDNENKDNETSDENSGSGDSNSEYKGSTVTKAEDIENSSYNLQSCYKYGEDQYVFLFYLGRVDNVPLQKDVSVINFTGSHGTTITKSLEKRTATQTEIEKSAQSAVEKCEKITEESTHGGSLEINHEAIGKVVVGIEGGNASASAKRASKLSAYGAYKKETVTTNAKTVLDSYYEAALKSVQKTEFEEITFNDNSEVGYYRMMYKGNFDCFAYVYVDFKYNTAEIDTFANLGTTEYTIEFSKDGKFTDNSIDMLSFNKAYLENLTIPENVLDLSELNPLSVSEFLDRKTEYSGKILNNADSYKITDTGYFGLKERGCDTLNLSACKDFMNDKHLFCFEVGVDISTVDNGYQEFYLYNNNSKFSNTESELANVQAMGMVCGSILTIPKGSSQREYIYWYVRGDEIKDTMYIRYDASGENEDTWYKNGITVNLTVVSEVAIEENAYTNHNKLTISQTGAYGLAPGASELLDVKDFYDKNSIDGGSYAMLFDMTMNYQEVNDGYQEVYLYNSSNTSTKTDLSLFDALDKGMLDRYDFNDGKGSHGEHTNEFTLHAIDVNRTSNRSESIADNMYIKYDAYGENKDTWTRNDIEIDYQLFIIPDQAHDTIALPSL